MINPIDGPRPLCTATPVKKKGKAKTARGSSFSKHLDEASGASSATATSALGSVSGVFNLQEVDDALSGEAKGKLRAEDLLDRLEEIRIDLLTGSIAPNKLQQLTQIVNEKKEAVSDPKLNEILEEIDLRAKVELAKFMRT